MSVQPVWFRPHRHLCSEASLRDAMTDAEFWDHVLNHPDPRHDEDAFLPDAEEFAVHTSSPCPECGQRGACAYDVEGRPMVHAVTEDDE